MRFSLSLLALASAALAAPLDKRAVAWVTVTDNVEYVETVTQVSTVIVWATVTDESAFATSTYVPEVISSSSEYVAPSSTEVYVAPSSTQVYVAPSSTEAYVAPSSTQVYVAPSSTEAYVAPSSTQVYVAPTTTEVPLLLALTTSSSSSEYVAPPVTTSSEVEPTSTYVYVAPTTTSTSEYVAPTTSTSVYVAPTTSTSEAAAASATTVSSSSSSSSGSGTNSGQGTFYATGLGSCGITSSDSDYIVAISTEIMNSASTGNPNTNPYCGKTITAYRGDKSVEVTVVDTCEACAEYDLDFSPSAFDQLGEPAEGRIDITWSWN
ncbi:RlpA-like double-psi beta-barrel-protein domain-containing protein-containing protein [Lipomyces japonicus]|uniref:RlpA-like double-psi beta-barrel-protein domain-containing protein-containing protein n=1 Tax=Lipomyces japonicus TaxID=56871 RepID=UPI0034CF8A12